MNITIRLMLIILGTVLQCDVGIKAWTKLIFLATSHKMIVNHDDQGTLSPAVAD